MPDAKPIYPDPYVGEIRLFGPHQTPKGWAPCDGRLLKVQDYMELFALIGVTYGGDGEDHFALPDLRGRVPIGVGGNYWLGRSGGEEAVELGYVQLPGHTHTAHANQEGGLGTPANNYWGYSSSNPYAAAPGLLTLNEGALTAYGKGGKHENRVPFIAVNYIIALEGRWPG